MQPCALTTCTRAPFANVLSSLRPYASREHATLLQVAVAAKTNTNDVSLLRLVNKFVRQVHGGRVTSCKVGPPLCVATLRCASRAVCAAYMASVRDLRVRVRTFACREQSAKDRSSMEITYEQALILEQQHDVR
jgi:hypothetical protein